jgi:hypothetical protein
VNDHHGCDHYQHHSDASGQPVSPRPQRVRAASTRARGLQTTRLRRPGTAPSTATERRVAWAFNWSGWGRLGKAAATFATLATSVTAIGALYVTSKTLDASRQQTALSEQGQYADRFGRAVEQLGSDKIDIRLGGIFALERLAKDSSRDASTITRLLATYLREAAPCLASAPTPGTTAYPKLPVDIDAALTVLSARDYHQTDDWADLTAVCLDSRNLEHQQLGNLDLRRANLVNSSMDFAQLRGVRLNHANLNGSSLDESAWRGISAANAQLQQAHLRGALLYDVDFNGSSLVVADLSGVHVTVYPPDTLLSDAGQEPSAPTPSRPRHRHGRHPTSDSPI